jgi:Domain of unknown function (DUF4157)
VSAAAKASAQPSRSAARDASASPSAAGENAATLAPPAYGIDFVDRADPTGLPGALKEGIEGLSGFSLDDVRVRYNSSAPAQLQALAYTQGNEIHVGPGQERHLSHEAWHVVQQKQGRVQATRQLKQGIALNDDEGLEKEADEMGAKALQRRADPADPAPRRKAVPLSGAAQPVQAKLGFEIEMLVLVDDNGRPVPEKERLGDYGAHCALVVDHGTEVRAATPEAPEDAESDLAMAEGYKRWWHHAGTNAWFESKEEAEAAHPGAVEEYYFNAATNTSHLKSASPLDWEESWWHRASNAVYPTEAAALLVHPALEIEKFYRQKSTNTAQLAHPFRRELGTAEYASIIEIVTNAYAPETAGGRADILQSMTDARTLAEAIRARDPRNNRFKLNAVAPGISDRYYVGNAGQPGQTVNGSIQANFGIELSQIGAFVDKTINDHQGGPIGGYHHPNYKVKHHTDQVIPGHDEGDVVRLELVAAATDANTIINAIANPGAVALHHLKGLMTVVCQYLRFGKIFYDNGYDPAGLPLQPGLVKNMIPLMARTDLSTMFNELVPAAEQAVINATRVAVLANILAVTGRTAGRALLNDPAEAKNENELAAWDPIYRIGCNTFITNVFTQAQDGVTANLGNIREMAPEKIDPSDWTRHRPPGAAEHYAHPGQPNQPNRPAPYREGAVFELRNMVPPGAGVAGVDRFIPATWPGLARYFSAFLDQQHAPPPPPVALPLAPIGVPLPPPLIGGPLPLAPIGVPLPPPLVGGPLPLAPMGVPLPPPLVGGPLPGPMGGPPPPVAAAAGRRRRNRRGCCFITTACVQARGLPDDCEELTVLRGFRDGYMSRLENGAAMIDAYYDVAPDIVSAIDASPNAGEIYEGLYRVISECVACIKAGRHERALHLYRRMISDLARQYAGDAQRHKSSAFLR